VGPVPPIAVVPYDETWPASFEAERRLLEPVLEPWLEGRIEHIGSTAVAGLSAKPVIDIMAGVRSLEESGPALELLPALGYLYAPYRAEVMHWLCKPSPERRTHHLHLVPFESPLWLERLAFRNWLRAHPATAREYEALKHRLATAHPDDREAYTEGKSGFVAEIVAQALPDRDR
jgi:GrpB-like predicted nucleotidyltransferase (UPF0157 family)